MIKMKCPVCNAELPSTARFCGGCGTTLAPPPAAAPEQTWPVMNAMNAPSNYQGSAPPMVQKKYKVLRFIAVLMKVFAFLAGGILVIAGVVMFIAGAAASSPGSFGNTSANLGLLGGALTGLVMLVYGLFVFIFLYAYAEWMYVFMDIEENTRVTNEMLSGRR